MRTDGPIWAGAKPLVLIDVVDSVRCPQEAVGIRADIQAIGIHRVLPVADLPDELLDGPGSRDGVDGGCIYKVVEEWPQLLVLAQIVEVRVVAGHDGSVADPSLASHNRLGCPE